MWWSEQPAHLDEWIDELSCLRRSMIMEFMTWVVADQLGSNKFTGMMGEVMNWVMTKFG